MRIYPDPTSLLQTDRSVCVSHGEQTVVFRISLYKQIHFREDAATFAVINEYWKSLPERDQEAIFNIYAEIRELFDDVKGLVGVRGELTDLVTRLMEFHSDRDVIRWIKSPMSRLSVPSTVDAEYTANVDKNTTRDKTYTKEDYYGLMALPIIFRAMIPIWSVFNKTVSSDGDKISKETHSFRLLSKSPIYTSEPMERLRRYIDANVGKSSHTGNHTLELICADDMREHYLALVCVRRLCLGDLHFTDPKQNLAALVYNFIIDRPGPQGGDFSKRVQEKKVAQEGPGETSENSGSTLELYKVRSSVTVGRIAEMEYPWRDPHGLALQLAPEYRPKHLDQALETVQDLYVQGIKPCMIQLAQWVVAPVFPPQGLYYMDNMMLLKALAVTETVLRTRGFKFLALLSTASAIVDDEGEMRATPVGSKSHISTDIANRIAEHFPYVRETRKRNDRSVRTCFVTEDIRDLSNQFMEHTWRATADKELVIEVLRTPVRRIPIYSSLRSDLALMLINAEEQFSA